MKKTMTALAFVLVLAGCGSTSGESSSERYERLANECAAKGGSFKVDEYRDKWSCTLPKPTPSPTPEVDPYVS